MNEVSQSTEPQGSEPQTRRRWWIPRFGLGTILLAMAAASVGAAWYSRSAPEHLVYPDGVKVYTRTIELEEGGEPKLDGDYHLVDEHGRVLARGGHLAGVANGVWTTYYPNGFRASTGHVKSGVAIGRWTYWTASGRRRAVIQYEPAEATLLSDSPSAMQKRRHGPAEYWHKANGRRASAGAYVNHRREGEWSFWDEQGQLIAKGEYAAGDRLGVWSVRRDGKLSDVYYLAGAEIPDAASVRERMDQLAIGIREGRLTWSADLVELEMHRRAALGQLLVALESKHAAVQAAVLLSLAKLGPAAEPARLPVQRLAESPSSPVRFAAAACLLAMGGGDQQALLRTVAENARGPIGEISLPWKSLASSLDIAVAEKVINNQPDQTTPEVDKQVRELVAAIVVKPFEEEPDRPRNDRFNALLGQLQSNVWPQGLRTLRTFPTPITPGTLRW